MSTFEQVVSTFHIAHRTSHSIHSTIQCRPARDVTFDHDSSSYSRPKDERDKERSWHSWEERPNSLVGTSTSMTNNAEFWEAQPAMLRITTTRTLDLRYETGLGDEEHVYDDTILC